VITECSLMNRAFVMSNGEGPTSQIATANLSVALYEWRLRRAQKSVKTAQVMNGSGTDHAMAYQELRFLYLFIREWNLQEPGP
jgi:hypothetical protein